MTDISREAVEKTTFALWHLHPDDVDMGNAADQLDALLDVAEGRVADPYRAHDGRCVMNSDREMAIAALQNLGWQSAREKRGKTAFWKFTRPDTGGLWDVFTIRQDDLSMMRVAEYAMRYYDAPELITEINAAKDRWLRSRFIGIYSQHQEKTP